MKMTIALILSACLSVQGKGLDAQTVSLSVSNVKIGKIFKEIRKQTGYVFFYDRHTVNDDNKVSIMLHSVSVEKAMTRILVDQPLGFYITQRTITVFPVTKSVGRIQHSPLSVPEEISSSMTTTVITGSVKDDNGQPLAGATILVKGTTIGTKSDSNGNFSINAEPGSILIISFVGFETIEVNVGNQTNITILLKSVVVMSDEVVVAIGYGSVKKKDITGAVSVVNTKDLQNNPVSRVDQMLAGRIAGAEFISTDGAPGSGTTVRIRGARSISASNEPLYVVDGVIDGLNNLNDLNPSDIASISVLKDASSTAIYGSRGANGVIIITTKGGIDKNGKTDVNLRTSQGFAELPSYLPLMTATQYAQLLNDNYFLSSTSNQTKPLEDYPQPDPLSLGKGSDWQRASTRRAPFANYSLTASGGTSNTKYYFSSGYDNVQGVILNSSMKRYQFRLNLDQTLGRYSKAGVRLSYSNTRQEQPQRYLGAYANWGVSWTMVAPIVPIYNPDGTLNSWNSQSYSGGIVDLPLFDLTLRKNSANTGTLTSMFYMEVTPVRDVLARSSVSYSKSDITNDALVPSTMPSRATAGNATSKSVHRNDNFLNENTISYKHTFGSDHHFDAMYGFTAQIQHFNRISISGSGYYSDETALWDIGSIPDKLKLGLSGAKELQTRMSHLARVNYNFGGKYYLTATLRRDGASNFAENNKWAYFPSAALRWNVLNENFMKNSKLDELAIRLSAGTSGNDAIARYQSLDRLSSTTSGYLFGGAQPVAFFPSGLSNAGLKWEKTAMYNAGIDLSLFQRRLNVTLETYQSKTSDLLLTVQLPTHTGFSSRLMNFGKTTNKGIELTINYDVIRKRDFGWQTGITAAHDKQMVEEIGLLGRVVTNTLSYGPSYLINAYQKGYPVNSAFGFQYAGVWHSQVEIDQNKIDKKYVSTSYQLGRQRYVDQNQDGVLNADDNIYLGTADPDVYGGWQNTLRYKKAFMSIYFNYSYGGVIYYPAGNFLGNSSVLTTGLEYMVNRWHPERNPDGNLPRPNGQDNIPNDRFLYDASFFRLKSASLGYTFDLTKVTSSKLKTLALSLNGSNLFLLKYYIGWDPEVNTSGTSSTLRRIDNGSYPANRTIAFTAELKF